MINKDTLEELEKLGFGSDVDKLESYVAKLQDAHGEGRTEVSDAVYDHHVRLLEKVKPESKVLHRNWEVDDEDFDNYDKLLEEYGMSSIQTITDFDELYKFKETLDNVGHPVNITATMKKNGHACRAVYANGRLVSGSTRGRYKKGRDITRHLKAVLPNFVDDWEDIDLVEVRGEMLVSLDTFENHLKGTLKTPLSSVTSLIRESATDHEIKLLDMVCFKVLVDNEDHEYDTLWDELEHLEYCGFKTPNKARMDGVTSRNLDKSVETLIQHFEGLMDSGEIDYACDGIIMAINDNQVFYSMGKEGNTWKSNIALKMGKHWASNIYEAIIEEIEFVPGKTYITPKAIIEPTVVSTGAEVRTVPLYNIGVMERYGYTPGETIYFRFGGETGVTCCDYKGESVRA